MLDRESSQTGDIDATVPRGFILELILFVFYTNNTHDVICNITIFADYYSYFLNVTKFLLCGNSLHWSHNWKHRDIVECIGIVLECIRTLILERLYSINCIIHIILVLLL